MKRYLHLLATLLFALCLLFDLVVWGAAPTLADIGPSLQRSANREAPLVAGYMWLGSRLDAALPVLGRTGADVLHTALADSVQRIQEDPPVAMDLIFSTTNNRTHSWVKLLVHAAPLLLVLSLFLWWRRPRQVSFIRR